MLAPLCHCTCSEWMHFSRSLSALLILTLHYRVCEISRTCLIYKLICQQQQIVRQLLLFQLQQIDWKQKPNWEEFRVRQFTRTLSPSLSLFIFLSRCYSLLLLSAQLQSQKAGGLWLGLELEPRFQYALTCGRCRLVLALSAFFRLVLRFCRNFLRCLFHMLYLFFGRVSALAECVCVLVWCEC